jgi:hypothetical protein
MPELGKVKKPSVEKFKDKRKLYLVPLISSITGLTKEKQKEYEEKLEKYWKQAKEQVGNLEFKMGQVKNIYHEFVPKEGEEGLKVIENLNQSSFKIVKEMLDGGAKLFAVEDDETLKESLDWQRCMMIGVESRNAKKIVSEAYNRVVEKRNKYVVNKVIETLQNGEAGLIFVLENNQFQFPSDIEIFYIAPPALDEIHRYLSDILRENKS